MKTFTKSLLLAVVITMAAGTVFAQGTETDTFAVTANVTGSCRISTEAVDIAFGAYLPWDADRTLSTTLGVQCIRGTAATISWVGQNDGSASAGAHAMSAGAGDTLGYDLAFAYGATALAQNASIDIMFAANSSAKTIDIDATLLGGQELVGAGSYTDNVTVSIDF